MATPLRALAHAATRFSDALAHPLLTSHYLELINPLWADHRLQARVEKVWDETRDARTLTLRPGRGWRQHRAGQYLRVGVPIGGTHHTRTYSISSSPDRPDDLVDITVKAVADGRVSSYLVRNLRPGAYLPVGLPQGEFVLPWARPVRPLFVTAGSGITPIMSMLRSYVLHGDIPDVVHLHYAPHEYDVIFGRELQDLATEQRHYHYHPVYTRGLGDQPSTQRHFSEAQLEEWCPDWRAREVWACGPQSLLDTLETLFEKAGRRANLNVERFRAALADVPEDAQGGLVRFMGSACEVVADGRTNLLNVAEKAGLNPPHGCRMGICRACDTTLLGGNVRDLRTGAITGQVGQKIQVCVCAAAGDVDLQL